MKSLIKITGICLISILAVIGGGKIIHSNHPDFSNQYTSSTTKKESVIYFSDNSSEIPMFSLKEEISQIAVNRVPSGKKDKNHQFCSTATSTKELFVKYSIIRSITLSDRIFLKFQKYDIIFPFHFFW